MGRVHRRYRRCANPAFRRVDQRAKPGATCLWEGIVSGGTTPFSYIWYNGIHMVSYTDSYTGGKLSGSSGSSFVLKFTVTNDAGTTYDQITVTEDSNARVCAY